jgi:septal ring factor EnvC (AmiA/AmiB activator)
MAVGVVSGAGHPGPGWLHGLALVALAVLLAMPARAADEKDLEALREAILEARERVGSHEREERALLHQLEESDRLSAVLTEQVAIARERARESRERAEQFEHERRLASSRLERTRKAMARRVVALYKAGEVGPVRFLFASKTVPDMLTRASALQTLVRYDADLVARYRVEFEAFERLERQARVAAQVRDEQADELEERSRELAEERELRRSLLLRVRDDRTQQRALLVELEKAARALEETLDALGDAADPEGIGPVSGLDFEAHRGRLSPPVAARIKLPFGKVVDEEFRTATFRKGVEFEAAGGESVRAVAAGVVRFAGWFRGYGRLVIVDQGDDYFTVLGHLADIFVEVGDTVETGDTLGSVGDTGSLSGPSLYFEIRQGSEPLDPGDWLVPGPAVASEQ